MSDAVTERLSSLGAELRGEGVRVGLDELLAAHRALAAVDPASRQDAFYALRAALCSRREDLEAFERSFEAVFGRAPRDALDRLRRRPVEATEDDLIGR